MTYEELISKIESDSKISITEEADSQHGKRLNLSNVVLLIGIIRVNMWFKETRIIVPAGLEKSSVRYFSAFSPFACAVVIIE